MYYCTDCGAITEGTAEVETVLESIPGIQRGASYEEELEKQRIAKEIIENEQSKARV